MAVPRAGPPERPSQAVLPALLQQSLSCDDPVRLIPSVGRSPCLHPEFRRGHVAVGHLVWASHPNNLG